MKTLARLCAKPALLVAGIVSTSVFPIAAFAQQGPGPGGYGGHMMWGWGSGFGGFLGFLPMILLVGAVIALVVFAVRRLGGRDEAPVRLSALDILKERFARGEIDRAEYDERRRVLES